MKLFLLSVILIGLSFAGIAIKIWAKKDGEFSGTCASQSPFLNKDGEPCGLCGKCRAANRLRPTASTAQLRVRLDFLFLTSVKNQEQTISDLVYAAKQEDQHAFRQLLDLHWNELYGFMIKRTENENDAEDLCLQAFSKAFDKIETYNDEFTFSTWLTSIAKNLHVDLIRKENTIISIDRC